MSEIQMTALRALAQAATPRPWGAAEEPEFVGIFAGPAHIGEIRKHADAALVLALVNEVDARLVDGTDSVETLRQALREARAELERVRQERDADWSPTVAYMEKNFQEERALLLSQRNEARRDAEKAREERNRAGLTARREYEPWLRAMREALQLAERTLAHASNELAGNDPGACSACGRAWIYPGAEVHDADCPAQEAHRAFRAVRAALGADEGDPQAAADRTLGAAVRAIIARRYDLTLTLEIEGTEHAFCAQAWPEGGIPSFSDEGDTLDEAMALLAKRLDVDA